MQKKSNDQKLYKSIPNTELRWVSQKTESGNVFYETSNLMRTRYFLWKQLTNGFLKIASGETPPDVRKFIE